MSFKLNRAAFEQAQRLIKGGLEVEVQDVWAESKPTRDEVVKFVQTHDMDEYALWFLAIKEDEDEESLDRYQLPYGDLQVVHKGALLDAQKKLANHPNKEIEQAIKTLLDLVAKVKR